MVHEPHKGFDLVRDFQLPNPALRLVGFDGVPNKAIDEMVGTFSRKGTIPCESLKGSVLI